MIELGAVSVTVLQPSGEPLQILRSVDLSVGEGETVAIVGRSGSGKTTLLNVVGLLESPSSGEYRLDGQDITQLSDSAASALRGRTFGFVFQQFNLLDGRSAVDNVAAPLLLADGARRRRRRETAIRMLHQVGLEHRLQSTPGQLSGGEQQRVALARALVRRPRFILADEPTGALDVSTGQQVLELLLQAVRADGAALLLITHDPAVAAAADRRLRLEGGVLAPDTP